jgi:FAD synthetase
MIKKATEHKVLIFGTFDRLHAGHLYFLSEAKKIGRLHISVASDQNTFDLKGRWPIQSAPLRKKGLEKLKIADKVFIGESKTESWIQLEKLNPDIVVLGYDQKELRRSLRKIAGSHGLEIRIIKSYNPHIFHSRKLNQNVAVA